MNWPKEAAIKNAQNQLHQPIVGEENSGILVNLYSRITILGLPPRTTWQDMKDMFRKAGEVKYTNMERNGDGTVDYVTRDGMEKAIEMFDDFDYNGHRLTVREV